MWKWHGDIILELAISNMNKFTAPKEVLSVGSITDEFSLSTIFKGAKDRP